MAAPSSAGIRNYAIVTAAYWGFTLTDGALRMIVLFTFFKLGYSPFTLAFLFVLYEAAGIGANFIGGWLAGRFGITRMLTVGLTTQICGFLILSAVSPSWETALLVPWVVAAQGICGVAKDLTKTASKSAIKVTEAGAVTLRIGADKDGRVVLSVQDTGRGLDAEDLERLYTPLEQASTGVARTHGGTGLGLAISRDLARLMDGDLTAESPQDKAHASPLSCRCRSPSRRSPPNTPPFNRISRPSLCWWWMIMKSIGGRLA